MYQKLAKKPSITKNNIQDKNINIKMQKCFV